MYLVGSIGKTYALGKPIIITFWSKDYSKTCIKRPLSKRPKVGFQDKLSLNAGQKYCRMLQLLTFIKLLFVIKIYDLSIFKWPFYTGFYLDILTEGDGDMFLEWYLLVSA